MPRRRKRLDPALFQLPADQLREGRFSDRYFLHARELMRAEGHTPRVLLQVASEDAAYVCGVDEAIAILRAGADDWSALTVHALYDGDHADAWDTVLTIEGPYDQFAHLETLLLGVLARRTRVCTNARAIVEAARRKPVLAFSARRDHWLTQPGDGHAAHVGGISAVATEAQASLWGKTSLATVPHALVAIFGGDTVVATRKFAERLEGDVPLVVPVDYDNDCVATSLAVARALDGRIWGVRLDTRPSLVDRSVIPQMGTFRPTGVNPQLVWNVRNALDAEGFGDVKILVSGGFDAERIRAYEEEGVPVDGYGVGRALLAGHIDFTADIVQVDGAAQARAGRTLRPNAKLERVK